MNGSRALFHALALVSSCIPFSFAVAQTSIELKAKYPSVQIYAMRPNVWLVPKFTDNGQPCELRLEKRESSAFSRKEIDELTSELVPSSARGHEKPYLGSDSFVVGRAFAIEREFENVSITEYGSEDNGASSVVIQWKERPCSRPATAGKK